MTGVTKEFEGVFDRQVCIDDQLLGFFKITLYQASSILRVYEHSFNDSSPIPTMNVR